jgi:hypothetical protein
MIEMKVYPICGDEHEDSDFINGICSSCASIMTMQNKVTN